MDIINTGIKIATLDISILLIFLSVCNISNDLFAQYQNPGLYSLSDGNCLVVWESENKGYFLAQYLWQNGDLEGNCFGIYSNELIAHNANHEFMITKTFDYPESEMFLASFSVKAKVYHSIIDSTERFGLSHHECHGAEPAFWVMRRC